MTLSPFVPGIELSAAFFNELVREIADRILGPERYAAALLGPGSEVLGLDSEMSTDHDWGARVMLVVDEEHRVEAEAVGEHLPVDFAGHPLASAPEDAGPIQIRPIQVVTVDQLCLEQVGFNPLSGVSLVDWLATSSNELLMLTAGAVFHDGVGELTAAREALAWYPADVWTWMVGCQWRRISQEHAFVARTVEAGDELGTRILAGRLAGDAIRLAFLIERRYAPYSKWLAKGLDWLSWGNELRCYLIAALCADDGAIRQMQLANAYQLLGDKTNALRLCAPVDTSTRPYYNRPSIVGPAAELSEALLAKVADPDLTRLRPHGAIDQLVDSSDSDWRVARPLYEALLAAP